MRTFALTLLIFVGVPISAVAQARSDTLDFPIYPRGPEAVELFREAWSFTAANIYPTELGQRFDPTTFAALQSRLQSGNEALADVFNPFLDSLGVSHTRLYDRRHQTYYMLRSLFSTKELDSPELYAIGVQLDEDHVGIVRAVMEGSPAAEVGLRRTDRIIAVDGTRFESLLQWQRPNAVTLTVEGQSGIRRDVTLSPILLGFHRSLVNATMASKKVIDCGDRRVGYLHLWAGTDDAFLATLKNFVSDAQKQDLGGLILDLRDGYGGSWWPYLDPFFRDRSSYFASTTLSAQGSVGPLRPDPQSNADAWLGPLAVIINAGTRSGKESLAFQFKKSGRALLFGTPTAGAFMGGRGVFADRSADYILYLSVQETLLDGKRVERTGVRPDVVIDDTSEGDGPLSAILNHWACKVASSGS